MKCVTGIGGIFFKTKDPKAMRQWYAKHLGIEFQNENGAVFQWRDLNNAEKIGQTVWSAFPENTKYFSPGNASFMINYRVENLDAVLKQLKKEGVTVDEKVEEYEFGKFGWIIDPEGNRIELWEPK
ncbi:VOC family protein [bacterium]|nr:VOC family protein [bacterium]